MNKTLVVVLLLVVMGCAKPVDKVYIYGKTSRFSNTNKWLVADVLEKNGTMWKIRTDGLDGWLDTELHNWKPYYNHTESQ